MTLTPKTIKEILKELKNKDINKEKYPNDYIQHNDEWEEWLHQPNKGEIKDDKT